METRQTSGLAEPASELRCRLLFMEVDHDRITVDAIVTSQTSDPSRGRSAAAPCGSPLALVLAVPTRPWGLVARGLLEDWVGEGREVSLRLRRRTERGSGVEVTSGGASMLLDLAV